MNVSLLPRIPRFRQPWLIGYWQILLRLVGPLLALGLGMALAARFELSGPWQGPAYMGFTAAWALGTYFLQPSVRRIITRWRISARKIWGTAGGVLGYLWLTQMPAAFDYRQLVFAMAAGAGGGLVQRLFVLQVRRTRRAGGEMLRWWGLAAVCAWAIHPYATPYLVGGGATLIITRNNWPMPARRCRQEISSSMWGKARTPLTAISIRCGPHPIFLMWVER